MSNKNWVNGVGQIKKGKSGNNYISLGSPKAKNPVNVEIRVTDGAGNVLFEGKNPLLNISNPRKRAGITDEDMARIPEYLMANLAIPPAKESA
jgi:hypothetical protein